jgi:hypothetical protein
MTKSIQEVPDALQREATLSSNSSTQTFRGYQRRMYLALPVLATYLLAGLVLDLVPPVIVSAILTKWANLEKYRRSAAGRYLIISV